MVFDILAVYGKSSSWLEEVPSESFLNKIVRLDFEMAVDQPRRSLDQFFEGSRTANDLRYLRASFFPKYRISYTINRLKTLILSVGVIQYSIVYSNLLVFWLPGYLFGICQNMAEQCAKWGFGVTPTGMEICRFWCYANIFQWKSEYIAWYKTLA